MNPPPRKRFGQHFLHDRNVLARIVAAIEPRRDDAMVEIGPGRGALTGPLLEHLTTLQAIEIDRDLAARLALEHPRLALHCCDVLEFDFRALPERLRVVGNLPYNVSTPLLFRLIAYAERLIDLHFMLQEEVVDRMVASPGTSDYGRLSVMLQYRFTMRKLFGVSSRAFHPPPRVDSAFVRMVPRSAAALEAKDERLFARIVTAAFTKRRKMLRNALDGIADEATLRALAIDPRLRPENLSVTEYAALANAIAS